MLTALLRGWIRSDYQVTFPGGDSVRRVQRRNKVEWYVNGAAVTEGNARRVLRLKECDAPTGT